MRSLPTQPASASHGGQRLSRSASAQSFGDFRVGDLERGLVNLERRLAKGLLIAQWDAQKAMHDCLITLDRDLGVVREGLVASRNSVRELLDSLGAECLGVAQSALHSCLSTLVNKVDLERGILAIETRLRKDIQGAQQDLTEMVRDGLCSLSCNLAAVQGNIRGVKGSPLAGSQAMPYLSGTTGGGSLRSQALRGSPDHSLSQQLQDIGALEDKRGAGRPMLRKSGSGTNVRLRLGPSRQDEQEGEVSLSGEVSLEQLAIEVLGSVPQGQEHVQAGSAELVLGPREAPLRGLINSPAGVVFASEAAIAAAAATAASQSRRKPDQPAPPDFVVQPRRGHTNPKRRNAVVDRRVLDIGMGEPPLELRMEDELSPRSGVLQGGLDTSGTTEELHGDDEAGQDQERSDGEEPQEDLVEDDVGSEEEEDDEGLEEEDHDTDGVQVQAPASQRPRMGSGLTVSSEGGGSFAPQGNSFSTRSGSTADFGHPDWRRLSDEEESLAPSSSGLLLSLDLAVPEQPDTVEPGDLVVLGPGVPSQYQKCRAVVTHLTDGRCTVVVLDSSLRFGVGECWPGVEDVRVQATSWRMGSRVVIGGLRGGSTQQLNGLVGTVAAHPREGHPTFICKWSAPGQPQLTLCVCLDDPAAAGRAFVLLEPRFLVPCEAAAGVCLDPRDRREVREEPAASAGMKFSGESGGAYYQDANLASAHRGG